MRHRDSYNFPFAFYPAVRIMLLIVIGISIAELLPISIAVSVSIFTVNVFGWLLFEFILRKKWMVLSSHGAAIFYSFVIISASALLMTFQNQQLSDEIEESQPIAFYEWEDLVIAGEIIDSGKSSSGREVFTVDVQETTLPDGITWKEDYKIRLYTDSTIGQTIADGNIVEAGIRLYEFPEQRNPHEFDYGNWLNSQGISTHGELQRIIHVEEKSWFTWGTFRAGIIKKIESMFDQEEAALAKALLLGYKEDLTPEDKQFFSRAGLSHIMAVSGLHVGFIVAPFWFFIPYLWGSTRGKWMGIIILTLVLISYAGLTGFSASVTRASLMAWLLTYGRLFHKVRNSINLTAVAAIILLLIDPGQLFDVGFQLSFSAVFIILLVMPEAKRLLPQKYHFGWAGGLMTIILVSIVVQLGLFPLLIYYFGEFSIVGPVSNALVIPILTFVVPVGLIIVLLSSMMPQMMVVPFEFSLKWIQTVASYTGGSSFSFITMREVSLLLFVIWVFIILAVASIRIPKIRWKMMICLLLAINALMIDKIIDQTEPKKLEVTFLDVGQGDAIHIKTPNGKHLLVDAGRWSPGGNSGEEIILPYFREKGIKKVDAILLSHPHADHIGGIVDLLQEIPVDTVYQSNVNYDSNLYKTYRSLADKKNIPVKYQKAGDIIFVDPSIRLFVLGPSSNKALSNVNNSSLVFKLVYGNTSVFFSGDAEKVQERELAERYGSFLQSDLYKVGHHGSNTSSSDSFIRFVEPDISVASLAFENRFRHPGSQAVSRLHEYSEEQHYTSLSGAVVYESDGTSFQKINWKD